MKDYIDNTSTENEIKMLFGHPEYDNKVIILLEGDSDIRVFRDLLNKGAIKLSEVTGKADVINVVSEINKNDDYSGKLLGICDADFNHILKIGTSCNNIFFTDTHDLETMLIESPAIKSLIAEYAKDDKAQRDLENKLVDSAANAAYDLGVFRLVNHKEDLKIIFKGLSFECFSTIDNLTIEINTDKLAKKLIKRSNKTPAHVDEIYLLSKYTNEKNNKHEHMQICCGHDITKFIERILSQRTLSKDGNINQKKIEAALRLSYNIEHFKKTKLYQSLVEWQNKYSTLKIVC